MEVGLQIYGIKDKSHPLPNPLPPDGRGGGLLNTTVTAFYSGLNLNQDKATKPQTVQIVRQGEATPYWFKVNPL